MNHHACHTHAAPAVAGLQSGCTYISLCIYLIYSGLQSKYSHIVSPEIILGNIQILTAHEGNGGKLLSPR